MRQLKIRQSGIELLRILAMLLIVAHHFALHTNWPETSDIFANHYIIEVLKSFGRVGAGIFFIITGYFLAKSKKTTTRDRILKTARPTWFYAITCLIFSICIGAFAIELNFPIQKEVYNSFLPIISNAYWFVSAYLLLEILSPYILKATQALSDKELLKLLAIYAAAGWGLGALSFFITGNHVQILSISSCIVYSIVGIAISRIEHKINAKTAIVNAILCTLSLILVPIFLLKTTIYPQINSLFWDFDSPLCIILASNLFILFSKIKIRSRTINYISSTMFGVYLIHDNKLIRKLLWQSDNGFFYNANHIYDNPIYFAIYSIVVILAVFIACSILEAIRKTIVHLTISAYNKLRSNSFRSDKN